MPQHVEKNRRFARSFDRAGIACLLLRVSSRLRVRVGKSPEANLK